MIAMITCYTTSRLLNVDYVGESGFIVYSRRSTINAYVSKAVMHLNNVS